MKELPLGLITMAAVAIAIISVTATYSTMRTAGYHQVHSSNVGGFLFKDGKAYSLEMLVNPTDEVVPQTRIGVK